MNVTAQTSRYKDSLFEASYVATIDRLKLMYISKRGADLEGCDLPYDYHDTQGYFRKSVVQNLLNSSVSRGTAFILYHFTGDSLHAFLVTSKDLYYGMTLLPDSRLMRWNSQLRNMLGVDAMAAARYPMPAKNYKKQRRKIRGENITIKKKDKWNTNSVDLLTDSLSEALFPAEIREPLKHVKHLIIQPQRALGLIPFCLLKPFDNQAMLIDSMSYSFSPHACNFQGMLERRDDRRYYSASESAADFSCLLVGNPAYSSKPYYLPNLPGAEAEVNAVGRIIENALQPYIYTAADSNKLEKMCTPLTGKSAEISKVIAAAGGLSILYLATHGYFDFEQLLDNSFIALAPDENSKTGFWTAKNIQQSRMYNKLVILSACQTGVGKVYEGGFIQIGRSFFICGSDNVVCSLWSVDDEATKELMTLFIAEMMQGNIYQLNDRILQPAQHLRKAMLQMRALHPEPSKWASFTVYGFSL